MSLPQPSFFDILRKYGSNATLRAISVEVARSAGNPTQRHNNLSRAELINNAEYYYNLLPRVVPERSWFRGWCGRPTQHRDSTVYEDFVAQQLQLLSRGTNHIAWATASPNAMFASFPGYPAAFNVDPMSPFFHKTAFTTARGKFTSSPAKALPDKTSPCKDSPSKRAQDAGGTHAMASALSVNMQTLQQKYKKIQNKLKAVQNEAKEILQLKVVVIKSHEDTIKNLQSKIRDLELALVSLQTRLNPI